MRPTVEAFSTEQVCRLSGASYRQVDYWARTGTLVPSLAEANGSGSQRRYTLRDVECARVLRSLTAMGWPGNKEPIAGGVLVADQLRSTGWLWDGWVLVTRNGFVWPLTLDRPPAEGWLVDPADARAHVASELQGLRAEETVRVLVG